MSGTPFSLEVRPRIPEPLRRLPELAGDLVYSWDRGMRGMFRQLDPALWAACSHMPKAMLHQVAQARLDALARDADFLARYAKVVAAYDHYLATSAKPTREAVDRLRAEQGLVAYVCAEYGLHESLKLYSGGLGVLAGDHCKAASNLGAGFVAVGLLYRQGYFAQTIAATGEQQAQYPTARLDDMPVSLALDANGNEIRVAVGMDGRDVQLRVWYARVGAVRLYLLDSDLADNSEADRRLTWQLYGGDDATRLAQEMLLGIGGVRALRALQLAPTAWHMNEGHAAFLLIERCVEAVATGLDFDAALEAVAASAIYTTHTPVPAGHDRFERALLERYLADYARALGVDMDKLLALGNDTQGGGRFNMTSLALRGSRWCNGVSRIHGRVASDMAAYIWPQVPPHENPMTSITNGVHVQTFLAREWDRYFDAHCEGWRGHFVADPGYWQEQIAAIPDATFWSMHQAMKFGMLREVCDRLAVQYRRNRMAEPAIKRVLARISAPEPDVLVLGFARRMATYKRVLLLFQDEARLARVLEDSPCPVVIIFAGKAHPQDGPGQDLIRRLNAHAHQREFSGRVFFVEDYDMALARALVAGVDVWLNNPLYPLEACGTSGQKAALNGVLNASVLDGWWPEAFNGTNGWGVAPRNALTDSAERDRAEADELLDTIEHDIIPLYCERNHTGYPRPWVERAKRSMQTVLPQFNAQRMFCEYLERCYLPATLHGRTLAANGGVLARELAAWKRRVHGRWPGVRLRPLATPPLVLDAGEALHLEVAVNLNGLEAGEVDVECAFGNQAHDGAFIVADAHRLEPGAVREGETLYTAAIDAAACGRHEYRIRCFPVHPQLAHRFETGCMLWA